MHKYPFKVIVWIGITFNGVTEFVSLPQKTTLDEEFYIENVLPIVKSGGNMISDQAQFHLSTRLIGSDIWSPNTHDLNLLGYLCSSSYNVHELGQKLISRLF